MKLYHPTSRDIARDAKISRKNDIYAPVVVRQTLVRGPQGARFHGLVELAKQFVQVLPNSALSLRKKNQIKKHVSDDTDKCGAMARNIVNRAKTECGDTWRRLLDEESNTDGDTYTGGAPPVAQYLILKSRLAQPPVVLLNRIRAHNPRDVVTRPRHFHKTGIAGRRVR